MTAKHTCNNGNGPVFGRKTRGCPRCNELLIGMPAVAWSPSRQQQDQARVAAIRAHSCIESRCSITSTANQW